MKHSPARTLPVVLALGSTLAVAACSSPTDSGGSGGGGTAPEEVTERLDAYRAKTTIEYPGEAFDSSAADGMKVWRVTMEANNPFLTALGSNFEDALAMAGVEVTTCDGESNPVNINSCISQAVAQGADAVQVDGPEPETYANALDEAAEAGIPVLSGAALDANGPLVSGLAGQSGQALPCQVSWSPTGSWPILVPQRRCCSSRRQTLKALSRPKKLSLSGWRKFVTRAR